MSMQMRIIDSETHPISPVGVGEAYPMDKPWRYPYIPGHLPGARARIAESIANEHFESLADALLARMDAHGVERAVIMRGAFPARNAALADLVKAHPDRFVAFAAWDLEMPTGSPPHESLTALDTLRDGLSTLGLRGVGEVELGRFLPLPAEQAYVGYVPTLELCRAYKVPILFHTGYDAGPVPIPYRNPIYFEPLAAEYPDVPIILAHMGKHDTWFFEGALMLARKRDNVYLSTSNTRREFVARAVEEIGAERLIWGSDWSMQHGILGLRQGFDVHAINLAVVRQAGLSQDDQALILGGNLARLLGL
jgi:uncharacterized protein